MPPDYAAVCEAPRVAAMPAVPEEVEDDQPADSAPFPISSSTGSEDSYTGPSTAESSQTAPPIPDELEPHQLARLQDLKESNA